MKFSTWWRRHRNGILGFVAAGIPLALGIEGVIPKAQEPYWLLAAGLTGLAISKFNYSNQAPPK